MFSSYVFKFTFALFDTPLFYLGVYLLKPRVEQEDAMAVSGAAA